MRTKRLQRKRANSPSMAIYSQEREGVLFQRLTRRYGSRLSNTLLHEAARQWNRRYAGYDPLAYWSLAHRRTWQHRTDKQHNSDTARPIGKYEPVYICRDCHLSERGKHSCSDIWHGLCSDCNAHYRYCWVCKEDKNLEDDYRSDCGHLVYCGSGFIEPDWMGSGDVERSDLSDIKYSLWRILANFLPDERSKLTNALFLDYLTEALKNDCFEFEPWFWNDMVFNLSQPGEWRYYHSDSDGNVDNVKDEESVDAGFAWLSTLFSLKQSPRYRPTPDATAQTLDWIEEYRTLVAGSLQERAFLALVLADDGNSYGDLDSVETWVRQNLAFAKINDALRKREGYDMARRHLLLRAFLYLCGKKEKE